MNAPQSAIISASNTKPTLHMVACVDNASMGSKSTGYPIKATRLPALLAR